MRILVAGALGEVGSTVTAALRAQGHEATAATSRAAHAGSSALLLSQAADRVAAGEFDLVVNAAGRGDRRESERNGSQATVTLGPACRASNTPGVLISTTRVLEACQGEVAEDAMPSPTTPYAQANAENEILWLEQAGGRAVVLRIVNYFCEPMSLTSPQSLLLPWSLVTEALQQGRISVRSAPAVAREFVGPEDVASACTLLAQSQPSNGICATTPGVRLTLQDLTDCVREAFTLFGRPAPTVDFGDVHTATPTCHGQWLRGAGWVSTLTRRSVRDAVSHWIERVSP